MNSFTPTYAQCYNLLYKDKDYKLEAQYFLKILNQYTDNTETLLQLGCGTGNYTEYFAQHIPQIHAVDISPAMLEIARSKNIPNTTFIQSDIAHLELNKQFKAVLSPFHVASYQATNQQLNQFFSTASKHLTSKGIFAFDFWYGPAVLNDLPQYKEKKIETPNANLIRTTVPTLRPNDNIVDVAFTLNGTLEGDTIPETKETHHMRYLFLPEIDYFLAQNQLKRIQTLQWMSLSEEPSLQTWNATVIAQKQ